VSRIVVLALLAACTPAAGTELETWDGVTAYAFGGKRAPVYARLDGAEASFDPPGPETDRVGFQCVELVVRYYYFHDGFSPELWSGDASGLCTHANVPPTGIEIVSAPQQVGDAMVFAADRYGISTAGHIGIIRAIHTDDTVDLFAQNFGNQTTAFEDGEPIDHAECFLHVTE